MSFAQVKMQSHAISDLCILSILTFSCAVVASHHYAICNPIYGSPSLLSCSRLLMSLKDSEDRFMGVPPVVEGPKPNAVSEAAWASRMTLPWVKSEGECNIALLSVLEYGSGGWYTSTIDNLERIAQTESPHTRGVGSDGIFKNCLSKGVGGFRQVGMSTLTFASFARLPD